MPANRFNIRTAHRVASVLLVSVAMTGAMAGQVRAHTTIPLLLSSTSIELTNAAPVRANFVLTSRSRVAASVVRGGSTVRVLATGWRGKGTQRATWDGRDANGTPVAPGRYTVVVKARAQGHGLITRRASVAVVSSQTQTPTPAAPAPAAGQLRWPLQGTLSSLFGPRGSGQHAGIDILAETGRPIIAATAGTVTFAGTMDGYGLTVVVQHPATGHSTLYAHQSRLGSKAGDVVSDGQVIGYVGSTGRSSAPHLHFEVRTPDRTAVDPLPLLPPTG